MPHRELGLMLTCSTSLFRPKWSDALEQCVEGPKQCTMLLTQQVGSLRAQCDMGRFMFPHLMRECKMRGTLGQAPEVVGPSRVSRNFGLALEDALIFHVT
eukprot:6257865-Amphidinium_carterae.1